MAALSVMINLELPHVNVLSKMDLLSKTARKHLDRYLYYILFNFFNILFHALYIICMIYRNMIKYVHNFYYNYQ